ncbi:MAG: hypothetical protein JNL07_11790 [Rhodospirillales bacterium]|nr:hypothetical protein [Rhodospirillales bacterium]
MPSTAREKTRTPPPRRRAVAALAGMSLAVAACGFEPLYGERAGTPPAGPYAQPEGVRGDLAGTRVAMIPDRRGQYLRNALVDRLNPNGEPERPTYYLMIRLHEEQEAVLVKSDETSTATNLRLVADFEIRDPQGAALTTGYSRAITRFNTVQSQYANIEGERNARERASRELAEDIRAKLAVFYTRRRGL